ncbi:MAG: DNA-directed RNA polymerase subunit H [Candidatus Aenigmarchaeota archaeon]|nr:DNA-directed RNA polymerase subunit H [Candidatus Aenigmarchaeota archaeon]
MTKEFDITKHSLVPKHELLDAKQKEEILKKYGITLRQFPRMLETDPMAVMMGAKPGDVLRIARKSETAGETTYYRVVIKA